LRKHRSLTFTKFVNVVSPDLIRRYIQRLNPLNPPTAWEELNGDELERYLLRPENSTPAAILREDFDRINDICADGMPLLVRACKKYGIDFDADLPAEDLAFRLFLDHQDAFDFAWTRYLLYAGTATLSVHAIPPKKTEFNEASMNALEKGLSRWFGGQAKGEQCEVSYFEDHGEHIMLLRHGTYVRAFPYWDGGALSVTAFRPALEDVMVFEPENHLLRIRGGTADRKEYLRLFADIVLGDEEIAVQAEADEVFTLTPFQNGTFSFGGDGPITRVKLRHIRMRMYGIAEPFVEVSAPDVAIALEHDLPGLRLDAGVLLSAKLTFHIQYPGERRTTRTFKIRPPSRSDLPDRRDTELILGYLERQGVKLH